MAQSLRNAGLQTVVTNSSELDEITMMIIITPPECEKKIMIEKSNLIHAKRCTINNLIIKLIS